MRSILLAEQNILNARAAGTGRVRTRHRVRIQDNAGVWQTYTAEAIRGRIRRSKDEPVATAEVTLAYRTAGNLSPWANVARPVDLSRGIQIESAYLDAANNPIAWHLRFDGFIQSVEPSGDWEMTITARDNFGRLVDRFTEQERTYGGGQRVDLVIQQVLNDWMSPAITLFVPTLPAAHDTVADDKFRESPVAEIVQKLALRNAWDLSFRWDAGTSSYRLTFIDPARGNATPTYTFEAAMFERLEDFGVERTNIRNRIEVAFGSGENRGSVVVSDTASISTHGTLYMRLGDDQGLRLQTSAQATPVANAILSDLAAPFVDAEYRIPYFPFAELNNVYRFRPTNREYDSDQVLAVVGIEEGWQAEESHTESWTNLAMRGRPVGGRTRWIDEGNPPGQQPPGVVTPPDAPTGLAAAFLTRDAILTWNAVRDAAQYEVRVLTGAVLRRTALVAEPGFTYTWEMNRTDHATPSASVTFEVRAIRGAVEGGVRSSAATIAVANPAPGAPTGLALVGSPLSFLASVNAPTEGDIDFLELESDDASGFPSPTRFRSYAWTGITVPIESTTGHTFVRARWVDVFGSVSAWTTTLSSAGTLVGNAHIAAQAVGVAQFAANIRPVGIGAALPSHPYAGYVEGDLFMLVVGGNETMHRLTNPAGAGTTGWTLAIGSQDIQAGAVIAGKVAAGAIGTTELAARSVTATRLAIADYSSLILNNYAFTGTLENWVPQGSTLIADASSGGPFIARQPDRHFWSEWIPCEPGRHYYLGLRAWHSSASAEIPSQGLHLQTQFVDANHANPAFPQAAVLAPLSGSGWRDMGGIVQAPANAAWMRFFVAIAKHEGTDLTRPWFHTLPVWRRAMAGELIVDGAVTASKITALDLNATQGTFGGGPNRTGVDTRGVRVYDAASALQVAVGDIGGLANGIGGTLPPGYGIWLSSNARFLGQLSGSVVSRSLGPVFEWTEAFSATVPANGGTVNLRTFRLNSINAHGRNNDIRYCIIASIFDAVHGHSMLEYVHDNDGSHIYQHNEGMMRSSAVDNQIFSTTSRIYHSRLDDFAVRGLRVRLRNTGTINQTVSGIWGVRLLAFWGDGTFGGFY